MSNQFYNVMPEATGSAPVVKVSSDSAAGPDVATKPRRFRFGKKALLIIPVILILAAFAFAGIWWMQHRKAVVQPTPEPTPQPQQTPDVTTPADWLARYFGAETCTQVTLCGDSADPDHDGLTNKEEYDLAADPNNPDSDSDGIADGDEKHVFGSDPLLSRTYRDGTYNDADFVKGGYDITTNAAYTPEKLDQIKASLKDNGLHQPTLTTIGEAALSIYGFDDPNATKAPPINVDQSPQAKLDRDTQRQSTTKKIGSALLAYKAEKKTFPPGSDFVMMSDSVKIYNTVATNYNDPINQDQFVYGYQAGSDGQNFVLTYFSETQNQLIKYTNKDAETNAAKENVQVNDDQRVRDLENIRNALLIYSSSKLDPNSTTAYVFPTQDQYPGVLVPQYITSIPKDPITKLDYQYQVSPTFDSFTLKATLQAPPAGTTGYVCNQDECKNY